VTPCSAASVSTRARRSRSGRRPTSVDFDVTQKLFTLTERSRGCAIFTVATVRLRRLPSSMTPRRRRPCCPTKASGKPRSVGILQAKKDQGNHNSCRSLWFRHSDRSLGSRQALNGIPRIEKRGSQARSRGVGFSQVVGAEAVRSFGVNLATWRLRRGQAAAYSARTRARRQACSFQFPHARLAADFEVLTECRPFVMTDEQGRSLAPDGVLQ
jgi:hypothetical protein